MKILILSPLFPPDIGTPAPYTKELMRRLKGHIVTGLVYGYLPESVESVTITAVDKRTLIMRRLITYTKALVYARRDVDLIILNNAPSVELPMFLVSLFTKHTIVLCESDPLALKASSKGFYKLLHTILIRRSKKVIVLPDETIYTTPEHLPFRDVDTSITDIQNKWWHDHLHELTTI
jgi:hypothetical protein